MLLKKTYIGQSAIHGTGVFAAELIKAGEKIWAFQEHIDNVITDEQFANLPQNAKEFVVHHGYYRAEEGGYILCGDNAKFTNHSAAPNTEMDEEYTYAIRDIQQGEEITEDYYNFDEQADYKLGVTTFAY